jgi:hypothetical protein
LPKEAMDAVKRIDDSADRAQALVLMLPYLPEDVRNGLEPERKGRVRSPLPPRRPLLESVLLATGEAERNTWVSTDQDARIKTLAAVVPYAANLADEKLYPLWCELLPLLAARPRKYLADDLRILAPILKVLGGAESLRQISASVMKINRCFP